MKRIACFLDGTWNTLDAPHATNVVKLAEMVAGEDAQGHTQIVYYDEGVGTAQSIMSKTESWLGGAFGVGLEKNVEQAFRFLVFNYEPGDEIYIFGFSRGAFTARTLAGLIRNCGIIDRSEAHRVSEATRLYRNRGEDAHPDSETSCAFRATFSSRLTVSARDLEWRQTRIPEFDDADVHPLSIAYLGVWDTVGALGVPSHIPVLSSLFNKRYRFHDAELSAMVASARQALALDERRRIFSASPWEPRKLDLLKDAAAQAGRPDAYLQQWYPGDHGSVGGGGDITGLSDDALVWIAQGAAKAGLELRDGALNRCEPDFKAPLKNMTPTGQFKPLDVLASTEDRTGPEFASDVSAAAKARWHAPADDLPEKELYRPKSLKKVASALDSGAR